MLTLMKRILLPFLLLSILFSLNAKAQTGPSFPRTFLWRISGNGLAHNSFLYGTMHMQDKRLFYFGDSLYHYLEQADGYAMEIDMQEFVDSMIQKVINQKIEDGMRKAIMGKDKKKTIDSLVRNVKLNNDKASKKQLEELRQEKLRKAMKNKEMPTIMDAYLYSLARRQGKWLGGIEDVQDQLSLVDELGNDISSQELLAPDKELIASLEEMVQIYLSQDLERLRLYTTNEYSEDLQDQLLFKRNKKMAMRMDSLAHVRSVFFAVGAAHLPGDSGVISLLRRKGYSVDPVFSSSKVDPVAYASKLSGVPWTKINGDDSAYQVEMPGKASDLIMYNGALKMKCYMDMGSLTCFMSGSTFVAKDANLDKMMENISRFTEGEVVSKKKITTREASGMECIILSDGYYFKTQYLIKGNRLYMLMSGGDRKETLERADVNKFFHSLVINKEMPAMPAQEWASFGLAEKAFDIHLPGIPKENKAIEKTAGSPEWEFIVYDYIDPRNGMYYMIQVRDLRPGFYLMGDTSYFSLCRKNMERVIGKITTDQYTTIESFPAFRLEGESADGNTIFKTLFLNRGGRVYVLFAGGPKDVAGDGSMDRAINSFRLTPYLQSEWKKESPAGANFFAISPSGIVAKEDKQEGPAKGDSKAGPGNKNYVCFDGNDAMSYNIFKTEISPYYWVENDSLFFDAMAKSYQQTGDSVLSKKWVSNGGLKGMQWVMQMPDNNNRKVVRQLRNGDTLLTLAAFIPSQYLDGGSHLRFFDQFRVITEDTHSTLFTNKTARLLGDLQSADTSIFRKASSGLAVAVFSRQDLPLLHGALLRNYMDDSLNYTGSRVKIREAIEGLADSSTVRFIQSHYNDFPEDKEDLRSDMLRILARTHTGYSYAVLKDILLNHTPVAREGGGLSYWIMDSLELARSLFPEILRLSGNHSFADHIITISNKLLDSSLITLEMLRPYENNFLHMADTTLAALKGKKGEEDYYGYQYFDLLKLLGHYNDTAGNSRLQQFILLDDQGLKWQATVALVENGQVVPALVIENLAADKEYRSEIYNDLVRLKSEKLYPARYMTQQYLSESDMYEYGTDEDEGEMQMNFVGVRTRLYKGEQKKFYLYRMTYSYENEEEEPETSQYLGVAGPYSADTRKPDTDNAATGIYYKEHFDPKKIDELLVQYLGVLEERENDD